MVKLTNISYSFFFQCKIKFLLLLLAESINETLRENEVMSTRWPVLILLPSNLENPTQ